jgi:hypothetical protein
MVVPGWTRTHGFFLIMGGFQLFERPSQPPQPVDGEKESTIQGFGSFVRILEIKDMYEHKLEAIVPLTSEAEIKDRGKSDAISKFIVLLQTSWFIIQCIARGIKHLPLTELEVVTLAYAMLNFFVYIFWWDKPREVGCPIRVYENLTTNYTAEEWGTGAMRVFVKVLTYILGAQDQFGGLSQERRVPMFWSGGPEDTNSEGTISLRAALGPSILGIAFGAIHCIPWSYVFPSRSELVLWRTSCITMMAVPLVSTIACISFSPFPNIARNTVFFISFIFLGLSSWLYIAARIATIVMAFTTLRSLPSEAFMVVYWTTFIPHI